MKNQKRCYTLFLSIFLSIFFVSNLYPQRGVTSTSTSTTGRNRTSTSTSTTDTVSARTAAITDLLVAYVIGGMLRHPDPNVRKQAIQSLAKGLSTASTSSTNTSSSNTTSGVRDRLFTTSTSSTSSTSSSTSSTTDSSSSIGPIIYIPDLYVLLSDPDPEVRDLASAGLDLIMGTDVTLLRLMSDPEPIIRKYATKIYAKRAFTSTQTSSSSSDQADIENINQLLALRTLLVRLKYEVNSEIRTTIMGAIEWYIKSGSDGKEGETDALTGMFGVDPEVLKFLDSSNPDLRKNAIRIISRIETSSYEALKKFMSMLDVEKDEGVKKELQIAIDNFMRKSDMRQGGMDERTPNIAPTTTPDWSLE